MKHSTPELILYVREQLAAGFTRSTLESTLAQAGWTPDAIAETFRLLVEQHKTTAVDPVPVQPVMTQEFSPEPTSESIAVSKQLDELLAGNIQATQPIQTTGEPVSIYTQNQAQSEPLQTPQTYQNPITSSSINTPQPLSEPFVDTLPQSEISTQDTRSAVHSVMSGDPVMQTISYSADNGIPETIISADTVGKVSTHHHHWWQVVILVILILATLGLLLLVLHALNVYDTLSINVPAWADAILSWVQSLIAGKA